MIKIHVARNRQPLGEFPREEVAEGLVSGKFLPTDLGWREPMDAWKPLSEFDELEPPVIALPPLPEGAVEVRPNTPETLEPAWERRAELGFFPGLLETVRQVYSAPHQTFRSMALTGGLKSPLLFYVILGVASMWASLAYQIAVLEVNPEAVMGAFARMLSPQMMLESQIATLAFAPIFVLVGVFVSAGTFHGMLVLLGAAKGNFEATFRAVCYSVGPAALLQFIPICGSWFYIFTTLVFLFIALREVHRADVFRVLVSVIVPMLLCGGLLVGISALTLAATGLK